MSAKDSMDGYVMSTYIEGLSGPVITLKTPVGPDGPRGACGGNRRVLVKIVETIFASALFPANDTGAIHKTRAWFPRFFPLRKHSTHGSQEFPFRRLPRMF